MIGGEDFPFNSISRAGLERQKIVLIKPSRTNLDRQVRGALYALVLDSVRSKEVILTVNSFRSILASYVGRALDIWMSRQIILHHKSTSIKSNYYTLLMTDYERCLVLTFFLMGRQHRDEGHKVWLNWTCLLKASISPFFVWYSHEDLGYSA